MLTFAHWRKSGRLCLHVLLTEKVSEQTLALQSILTTWSRYKCAPIFCHHPYLKASSTYSPCRTNGTESSTLSEIIVALRL